MTAAWSRDLVSSFRAWWLPASWRLLWQILESLDASAARLRAIDLESSALAPAWSACHQVLIRLLGLAVMALFSRFTSSCSVFLRTGSAPSFFAPVFSFQARLRSFLNLVTGQLVDLSSPSETSLGAR